MPYASVQFVPAVAFSGWTCLAILVMMFVGWILNVISASKNPPAPARRPQRPPRRGDERLQSEIDRFLEEVGVQKRRVPHAGPDGEELEIELVPEDEQQFRRDRPQSVPPEAEAIVPDDSPLSDRHLKSSIGSSLLGTEPVEQLVESLRDVSAETVEEHLRPDIGSAWTRRGEAGGGNMFELAARLAPEGRSPTPAEIAALLRSPVSVRQAILLSEVLSPPRSRRNRRG